MRGGALLGNQQQVIEEEQISLLALQTLEDLVKIWFKYEEGEEDI